MPSAIRRFQRSNWSRSGRSIAGRRLVRHGSVILDEDVQWQGPDSYHAHPYPCPRICARLILGAAPAEPNWIRIRAEGTKNGWEYRDGVGVMSIEGQAGASNGFSYGPVRINTREYPELHVKLSGTENARFYVDLMECRRKRLLRQRLAGNADRNAVRTFTCRRTCLPAR